MTLEALAESGEFQGLFQATFGEEFDDRNSGIVDVRFLQPVEFSFTADIGRQFTGRFTGEAKTPEDQSGSTSGTLDLLLPRGLDAGEAKHVLDGAVLKIEIEAFPGW